MYLADFYIDAFNSSSIYDLVNKWIDAHSDKTELVLAEMNGKGKWNSCHEYYLKEAATFIVNSASSTPGEVRFGKRGIDFVKNDEPAMYAYHPLKAFPFLCMVYTLYMFSDRYTYDSEKKDKLYKYLLRDYKDEFIVFIERISKTTQPENQKETPLRSAQSSSFERKVSVGRPIHTLKECIMLDDKQSVIEEMKRELDRRADGPEKAFYIYSLVLNGILSKFPSHSAFKDAGLIILSKTAWNIATKPYRDKLANSRT